VGIICFDGVFIHSMDILTTVDDGNEDGRYRRDDILGVPVILYVSVLQSMLNFSSLHQH
jgi:hypothetical protein